MHKTFRIPFIGIQIEKRKQLPKRNTKEPKRPLPPLLLPALDFAGALVLAEGPFQPPVAVAVPLDDERSIPALGTTKPVEVKSAPAGPTAVTLPRRGGVWQGTVVRERQGAGGLGGGEGRCGRGSCEEGIVVAPREGLHDSRDAWDA
jgi:hypothetical protein